MEVFPSVTGASGGGVSCVLLYIHAEIRDDRATMKASRAGLWTRNNNKVS